MGTEVEKRDGRTYWPKAVSSGTFPRGLRDVEVVRLFFCDRSGFNVR